jgi:hypothetical protein
VRKDEKLCPQCAEVIKLAATRCKHCNESFPREEVEREMAERRALTAERAQARKDKKLDAAIAEHLFCEIEDLAGQTFRPFEVEEISTDVEVPYDDVVTRLTANGAVFEDRPRALDPDEWSEEVTMAIDRSINELAVDGVVGLKHWQEIEDRLNVSGVPSRIVQKGLSFENENGEIMDAGRMRQYAAMRKASREAAIKAARASVAGNTDRSAYTYIGIGCGIPLLLVIAYLIYAFSLPQEETDAQRRCTSQGITCDREGKKGGVQMVRPND